MDPMEVQDIVYKHIDAIVKEIQERMQIDTGDVAGIFFTGGAYDLDDIKVRISEAMLMYVSLETLYKDDKS
jgi:hypothetical protein